MKPKTYLIGVTSLSTGLLDYLRDTGQYGFWDGVADEYRHVEGQWPPEILVSFYAKMCYRSLVEGKNSNVTKTRGIEENIKAIIDSKHGSVFEHVQLNFVTTNCSRVFTHELVRHRVGVAYSQTSGRYCTVEDAELVLPEDAPDWFIKVMRETLHELKERVLYWRRKLGVDTMTFTDKKKWTSTLRRIMPNGATNEMGWSANVRALRHMIEMRTSRHAEWEIRHVFNEVAELVKERWPLLLHGAEVEMVEGYNEWTNLRI